MKGEGGGGKSQKVGRKRGRVNSFNPNSFLILTVHTGNFFYYYAQDLSKKEKKTCAHILLSTVHMNIHYAENND